MNDSLEVDGRSLIAVMVPVNGIPIFVTHSSAPFLLGTIHGKNECGSTPNRATQEPVFKAHMTTESTELSVDGVITQWQLCHLMVLHRSEDLNG
jgi:hypothetical protein